MEEQTVQIGTIGLGRMCANVAGRLFGGDQEISPSADCIIEALEDRVNTSLHDFHSNREEL